MENAMKSFGENVFRDSNLKKRVSKEVFKEFKASQLGKTELSKETAEVIANAIKDWATKRGATHYCHWFQPLTDLTAEKHDSFLEPTESEELIYKFSGSNLIKGEPDASSFPNGGLRSTFEARGYTIWDTSSYPFIRENKNGVTLYIPTAFISFTGEALDKKVPLLRTMKYINEQALRVLRALGNTTSKHVFNTLGVEQEYFLVKKEMFEARDDLLLTGRTLFGAPAPKGQELSDHYFGKIKDKVINFMSDVDVELWKLGIPSKTRHNEVAPNQFEVAPLFSVANLASDQNQIIMETIEKTALKHDLVALLHEKPFDGVNGSGKHNNWSLSTNTGENLLSPGKNPKKNLQFLTFFVNVIKAANEYADLLRAGIATAGNDYRLGANEAPPAIISVFIGSQLYGVLEELEKVSEGKLSPDEKYDLKLNVVGKIPEILLDNTDRNRTSPFAFTGNKFEIRAVGSSANCAEAMTIMNSIMAKQLRVFKKEVDALIDEKGLKKDEAIFNVLREYIKQSKNIMFEGDGYSEDWVKEAKKRGLSNLKTTPEALKRELDPKFISMYEEMGIYTQREIEARNEIKLEKYSNIVGIEAKVLADVARNHIIPSALKYQNRLIDNVKGLKEIYGEIDFKPLAKEQMNLIERISHNVHQIKIGVDELLEAKQKAQSIKDNQKQAEAFCQEVKPLFSKIREASDALEMMVDDELWPMTKYRELLFTK
mgnify:CR=1 FL=1